MANRVPRELARAIHRLREEEGQAMVEYALLVSLIAVAGFVAVEVFGQHLAALYTSIVKQIP